MKTAAVTSLAIAALTNAEIFEARQAEVATRPWKKYVTSEKLQKHVELDNLLAGSQKLQDIADGADGHRAFGSKGHNQTVDYIVESLQALDYYDVVKQPFHELYASAEGTLSVDGKELDINPLTYTPSGSAADTPLVKVNNLGCEAGDFPAEVEGNIAFISRGDCPFSQKTTNAKTAGAVGAVIYNHLEGPLSGTLGDAHGDYVPVVGISNEDAQPILKALEAGEVTASLDVDAVVEDRVTFNVIAETKGGDHDNVLVVGGHSDSVPAGPGINDDGSGIIALIETATALSKFKVKNAVRFGFWSAEEFGLLGSYHYVKSLNSSDAELSKIRAYLNFDMIASPNYMLGIYDGDGSAFNLTGPPGSAQIEANFEQFFRDNDSPSVPTEFSGRSDYAAFIENGIPSGGLFTGAEVLKTAEEAVLFGGEAGVAYDVNYHKAGDDINNLNNDAYLLNTKAIADAIATYAISWESIEPVDLTKRRWAADRAQLFKRVGSKKHSHSGPCGGGNEDLF